MLSSFNRPALDGSLNVLDCIGYHGQNNSDHPLFIYSASKGNVHTIRWGEAIKAIEAATQYVLIQTSRVKNTSVPVSAEAPVVGILANLDSITYYTLIIGLMNAGYTPFLISLRNSANSVAHLLFRTKCQTVFVSDDLPTTRLASSSFKLYEQQNPSLKPITQFKAPSFDILYKNTPESSLPDEQYRFPLRRVVDQSTPCVILHSSGTVSVPKPVVITYRMLFEHALVIGLDGDFSGDIVSIHSTPMYHMMGLRAISHSAFLGVKFSVFRPCQPPTIPSPEAVLNDCVATLTKRISCPPTFLESWANNDSDIQTLRRFEWIMYGGGPLKAAIGDMLVREGVNLLPTLGLTELGSITSYIPKATKAEGWNWFSFNPYLDIHFVKEDGHENDVYRMIIKKNSFRTPAILNTSISGVPAYDTHDLYVRHPTNSKLWMIVGRSDDQIMHSTGEKTNPVPIEAEIMKSPDISYAVMFGRERFQPGVLIYPAAEQLYEWKDTDEKRVEYVERIWPHISFVNQSSPQHSRIFKEMILVADPDKQVELSGKGSVRRMATLQKYELQISELYEPRKSGRTCPSVSAQVREPLFEEILTIVKDSVLNVLEEEISNDDDIFRAGADSLCALSIKNTLVQRLKESAFLNDQMLHRIPRDMLYAHTSISRLSVFIYELLNSSAHLKQIDPVNTVDRHNEDYRWQTLLESKETVVEMGKGNVGIPLIVLSGSSGTLHTMRPLIRCTSKVWGVQVTDETPQNSIQDLAIFYRQKIKEKQPNGPYRLASFSGSCVIVIELVLLFQRSGDKVVQFAMMDHFPTFYFPSLNPDLVEVDNPEWWTSNIKKTIRDLARLIGNTAGELSSQAVHRCRELEEAISGGPVTPTSRQTIDRYSKMIRMSLLYMLQDKFMEIKDAEDGTLIKRWSPKLFRSFVADIVPRLTVYIAKDGIRLKSPKDQWARVADDLGARELFPDADVMQVKGNHVDFLGDVGLLKRIQDDYPKDV